MTPRDYGRRVFERSSVKALKTSVRLDAAAGDGVEWMPSTGNTIKRAVSAPGTWRRLHGMPDLFAGGEDAGRQQGSCLTPRASRTAVRSQHASAERTAATTATPAAAAASGAAAAAATPRSALAARAVPRPISALSPRLRRPPEEPAPEVMPQSPVKRDAHHSPGIWREMPTFSRWGRLDSMRQPSVAVAVAVAGMNKAEQAASQEQVLPYPGFVPKGEEIQEERQQAPTSARAHYLKEMLSNGVRCDTQSDDMQNLDEHSTRPRGLSPRQRSASWASGGGRSRRGHRMSPWQSEENAILKSPREPTQSMSGDAGPMPAGMHPQAGWAAAALERAAVHAAGYEEPMEPLQLATGRSDDVVHPMEGSCVTPRNFCPPSRCPRNYRSSNRTGNLSSPNKSFSIAGSQSSHGKSSHIQDDDFSWPGTSSPGPELRLDLPGLRRARAASSGYSKAGPRRTARWRV